MMFKTHAAAGIASAVFITHPDDIKSLFICGTAACIGSVISDVDVTTSKSRKGLGKIIAIAGVAAAVTCVAEFLFKPGIFSYIQKNTSLMQVLMGIIFFIAVCIFGEHQPHRTFMHSIIGGILLTASVAVILPQCSMFFAIGFISHILLDLLNEKKVQLLYPSKKLSFSLCVCKAGKTADKVLCLAFSLAIVAEIIFFIFRVYVK